MRIPDPTIPRSQRGFSIIELMTVLAIAAIFIDSKMPFHGTSMIATSIE